MAALSSSSPIMLNQQVLSSSSSPIKTGKDKSSNTAVSESAQPIFSRAFDHIPLAVSCPRSLLDRVYVTTNETSQKKSISVMQKYPLVGNAFLAVSGFCGLNMMSACGERTGEAIDHLIMVDSSPRVEVFWLEMQKIIHQSSTRCEAWIAIQNMLFTQARLFYPTGSDDNAVSCGMRSYVVKIAGEIEEGISWLSTDKRFEKVKRIFDADHFIFKRVNLCDREATRLLAQAIRSCGLTLHAGYISNIREYAENRNCLPQFQESIRELRTCMNNQSFLIDTQPRLRIGGSIMLTIPLVQRIMRKIITSNIKLSLPSSPEFSMRVKKVT